MFSSHFTLLLIFSVCMNVYEEEGENKFYIQKYLKMQTMDENCVKKEKASEREG